MPQQPTIARIAPPLLRWYAQNARDLPWRHGHDPYRVWVSEIMLQQTRVEAAKPYYLRFLQRLPTLADLAAAPEEELLKLWEGLGYYSRARNLQKAARLVTERLGGRMPDTAEGLRRLPGIGDYTAGAVASIAFGRREACVDGNVLRVFARLRADQSDVSAPAVRRDLAAEIARDMPPCPGDFNQALMELGALVCLPGGEPLCGACPLAALCRGRELGVQRALPVKAPKPARLVTRRCILVLRDSAGRVALRRRAQGPLKGMWELPGADLADGAPDLDAAQVLARAAALGFGAAEALPLGPARHVFTHREWQMQGWLVLCPAPFGPPPEGWVWAGPRQLEETYALPAAFRAYRPWAEGQEAPR